MYAPGETSSRGAFQMDGRLSVKRKIVFVLELVDNPHRYWNRNGAATGNEAGPAGQFPLFH
jgi:hypothetical protein